MRKIKKILQSVSLLLLSCSAATEAATPQEDQPFRQRLAPKFTRQAIDTESVKYADWTDEQRHRSIPIKFYLPKGTGPFPIFIFSHGLGGSREAAEYLGSYLASKGYYCVFVQHPGSDSGVWQNNGIVDRASFFSKMQAAANGRNWIDRANDIKFVIDELEKRSNNPDFKGKLNLSKIAIGGHSFGAGTSLAIAGQGGGWTDATLADKRVSAAVYLCPPVTDGAKRTAQKIYSSIKIPGLLLTGTEDNSPIGNTSAKDRRIPFDNIVAPHQYLANFNGADHATFGGRSFRTAKSNDETYQQMIETLTLHFLDATLKSDEAAWKWLDGGDAEKYLGSMAIFEKK